MSEIERIVGQLDAAYDGEAWHGPSVRRTLRDVTAAQAAAHPIAAAHSIWELVGHVAAWKREVTARLGGAASSSLEGDRNFPPAREITEVAWEEALADLDAAHRSLREAVVSLTDSRLDEPMDSPPDDEVGSVYATVHGVIQHDLYHAGQIAILRRA